MRKPSDPRLSVSEREHGLIGAGRLYRGEDFDPDTLDPFKPELTRRLITEQVLVPSVTNVIGMLPKGVLMGWMGKQAALSYAAAISNTNEQRSRLIADAVAAGVTIETLALLADPATPPAYVTPASTRLDIEQARTRGHRLITVATMTLKGRCTIDEAELHFTGVADRDPDIAPGYKGFYLRKKKGQISEAEYEALVADARLNIHRLLSTANSAGVYEHAWVYAHLPVVEESAGGGLVGDAGSRARDHAATYGTAVHNLLEDLAPIALRDGIDSIDPAAHRPFEYHVRAWQTWWTATGSEWTEFHPELTVRGTTPGDGLRYAGTADVFAVVDGVGTVADYKTSKSLSTSSVALQMAALYGANEGLPFPIERGIGVHLPRPADAETALAFRPDDDPSFDDYKRGFRSYVLTSAELERNLRTFHALRRAWHEVWAE